MKIEVQTHRVRWGVEIPIDQGIEGPNERCIELALGLELADVTSPGWVLDAGCALLPVMNTAEKDFTPKANVVHLTQNIASESCVARAGQASFVSADLRKLDIFATGAFDRVVCISTLEHIGCDNSQYGAASEQLPDSVWLAVRELARVSDGDILITVPVHPTGYNCGRWRYFTVDEARLVASHVHGQLCYYASNQAGHWYGGTAIPLPFAAAPSSKVQQIACIRS